MRANEVCLLFLDTATIHIHSRAHTVRHEKNNIKMMKYIYTATTIWFNVPDSFSLRLMRDHYNFDELTTLYLYFMNAICNNNEMDGHKQHSNKTSTPGFSYILCGGSVGLNTEKDFRFISDIC